MKKIILSDFKNNNSMIFEIENSYIYDIFYQSILTFKTNLDYLEQESVKNKISNNKFFSEILKSNILMYKSDNCDFDTHRLFISTLDYTDEIAFTNNKKALYIEKNTLIEKDLKNKIIENNLYKYFSKNFYQLLKDNMDIKNTNFKDNITIKRNR